MPLTSTTSTVTSAEELVHEVSAQRVRLSGLALAVGGPLLAVLVLILDRDRDTLLGLVAACGMLAAGAGGGFLIWLTRDISRFKTRTLFGLFALIAPAAAPVVLFMGTSTFICGFLMVFLLQYAMDASLRETAPAIAMVTVAHLGFEILVVLGVVADPGLFAPPADSPRWLMLPAVPFAYVGCLFLGHAIRRRMQATARTLANAVSEAAMRGALLREARRDLEQAAGIGEAGRYTDQELGDHVLGPILGRGGMGEIYSATHREMGAPAAVKVLTRHMDITTDDIARFEREARIVSGIRSPHVVSILDMSPPDAPLPFITMERLEGGDLARILRDEGCLAAEDVVEMVRQVSSGLAAAHAQSVIHRDVKPPNLFRTEAGLWKVLDFGVARLGGSSGTLTGNRIVGTPQYMAPEQVGRGGEVDVRTDVHGLAVVTYRALTGRPAFAGADMARTLYAVVHELPPPPSASRNVPRAVDAVLRVGMAKEPGDRFDTAPELAEALARAIAEGPDPALERRAATLGRALPWGQAAIDSEPERTRKGVASGRRTP